MPGTDVTTTPLLATIKLGTPQVADFSTDAVPGIPLSATDNTVVDFGAITDTPLVVPGVPVGCGYKIVDGSTGAVVDYGATVSESAPNLGAGEIGVANHWDIRFVFPPVSGAPHINIHLYVTYFPYITAPDSF